MTPGLIDSARGFVAGLLELGRTRFELFGAELREELARLATGLLGGLAVFFLAAGVAVLAAAEPIVQKAAALDRVVGYVRAHPVLSSVLVAGTRVAALYALPRH